MAIKSGRKLTLPVIVEKDEDGFYVVECPLLKGCYTQGETLDEALKNIREVIEMCLKNKERKWALVFYRDHGRRQEHIRDFRKSCCCEK